MATTALCNYVLSTGRLHTVRSGTLCRVSVQLSVAVSVRYVLIQYRTGTYRYNPCTTWYNDCYVRMSSVRLSICATVLLSPPHRECRYVRTYGRLLTTYSSFQSVQLYLLTSIPGGTVRTVLYDCSVIGVIQL